MTTYEVTNAGTVYRLHITTVDRGRGPVRFVCLETGWGRGYGEWLWIDGDSDSIAWDYIAEKVPAIETFDGDKPGWKMAFAKAGIEVFG